MITALSQNPQILIQGITGKEGQRSLEWLQAYGTQVVAGVTPGKGGQSVNDVPVYNSVAEALQNHPGITVSSIYVPPKFVRSATLEALEAGIKNIHIIGEEVPLRDTAEILEMARARSARVLGPSSIGAIVPGKAKVGSIGGSENSQFQPGNIAVLSKSGGMSSEISLLLQQHGYGQSFVVGIGGNVLIGTTFADLVDELEADPNTHATVVIGEIGGWYEELLAEKLASLPNHKPYLAFISGQFAETLPQGMSFGHAGAIVDSKVGTRQGKREALQAAGAHIIDQPSDIVKLLQTVLSKE